MNIISRIKERIRKNKTNTEAYRYIDGKGKKYFLHTNAHKPLKITMDEARRIVRMMSDDYSVMEIYESIDWHHNITPNTIRTFTRNYVKGMFDGVL